MMSLVTTDGKRFKRTASGRLAEPGGQLLLDFEQSAQLVLLSKGKSTDEPDYDALLEQALECELALRPAAAAELYQRMLVHWPQDALLWFNLGNSLYAAEQVAAAAAAFRAATAQEPDHAEAWNNLGAALLDLADWETSELALKRSLKILPNYELALANLADLAALRSQSGGRETGA
jgi:Tfp pilus assembly protein PilF